jgi:hypothetical protein
MPGINSPRALQVIDPFLTGIARNYQPNWAGFIGDKLLPATQTGTLSGQYPIFDDQFWFGQQTDNKVDDRSPAKEVNFTWSTDTYLCEEYALKVSISDLEEMQAHPALKLRTQKTKFLAGQMKLAQEVRAAGVLLDGGAGGGLSTGNTTSPSNNWDVAAATIEDDIKAAVLSVYDRIGTTPNTLVIPYKVAYAMALQEDIRAIIRYDATGKPRDPIVIGDRVLPSVIHGMNVVIPTGAQKSTAAEGPKKTVAEIWGDDVRLLLVDPGAQWGMPTVGYRITHTGLTSTRWRQIDPDVEYIRQLERVDEKIVAPDAGWVLADVLS